MYFDFHTHQSTGSNHSGIYNLEALAPPSLKGCSIGVHPWWIDAFDKKHLLEWVAHHLDYSNTIALAT
jgi:hypothetical protein